MSRSLLAVVCLAALSTAANAQVQTRPAASDPLDAQAAVPPARHVSAMSAYRTLAETPVGSWKDANERVNRIGGWRVYAREAAQPAPTAPAASAPGAPAAPAHRH